MNTPALYAAVDSVLAHLDTQPTARQRMYVTAIPARHLFVDHTYQRPLDEDRIAEMVTDFNPELLGVIDVSDRGDGTFAIVEGQHRWAAAREAHPDRDGVHLVCLVHTGLTSIDEAHLFHQIDVRRRALSGWDRWKARRGAGDPVVAEIEAVVTSHGLLVDPAPRDGSIAATRALETVYELGGRQLLSNTILVLTRAYRISRDAYDGALVHGLALVLHHYDLVDELNIDRLVTALEGIAPRQIKARAATLRETHRGVLPRLLAAVVVNQYNQAPGRRIQPLLERLPSGSKYYTDPKIVRREQIRRWAIRQQLPVGQVLSQRVIDAYTAAHPTTTGIDQRATA